MAGVFMTLVAPALAGAAARAVSTLDDAGPGSLRQAIADAAANDTITFGVTGTITLTQRRAASSTRISRSPVPVRPLSP